MVVDIWVCKACGATYRVSSMNIGSREREYHTCEDCGEVFVDGKIAKVFNILEKIKPGRTAKTVVHERSSS